MLLFLGIWLLILWLGSVALEATGMERAKARFQALSALSGTGFTTREAESIIDHPKRRRIVSYLIFLGNAGIVSLIIILVLYVRSGLKAPSMFLIAIAIAIALIIALALWLGLIDKLSNAILSLSAKGHIGARFVAKEILHQIGDHGVFRLVAGEQTNIADLTLKDVGFQKRGITILAIERGDNLLPQPEPEEKLLAGDYLLCYGKLSEVDRLT